MFSWRYFILTNDPRVINYYHYFKVTVHCSLKILMILFDQLIFAENFACFFAHEYKESVAGLDHIELYFGRKTPKTRFTLY